MELHLPATPRRFEMFIDGCSVSGPSSADIVRQSPAHGVPVSVYQSGTAREVDAAVAAARRAFDHGDWPRVGGAGRAAVLLRAATLIREHREELAIVETLESGKPIT